MKKMQKLILAAMILIGADPLIAQTGTNLDLSTRWTGQSPTHETPTSAAQWMQNPIQQKLEITVTNFFADADQYMEIDVAKQQLIFYGAGQDGLGNYIATNYPPVEVDVDLRHNYPMSIMCPNSGPNGSPFFHLTDFPDPPDGFIAFLTNSSPDAVSAYLWSQFTTTGQYNITNAASSSESQLTNLVQQINIILAGPSIYDSGRFSGVTLSSDTATLLAENPTGGQDLIRLNRLLLQDAYASLEGFYLPPSTADNSGTAEIMFDIQPPPQLIISKVKPAPQYTVLVNGIAQDDSSPFLLQHPADGDVSQTNGILNVLKDKFGRFGLGDGCDDATKAPGQGAWMSMGPGCNQDTNRISIAWSVSLGRTFDGLAAGLLTLHESTLSLATYTPYSLYYNGSMTNLYQEMPLGTPAIPFVPTNIYSSVILVTTNIPILMTNSAGELYTNYDDLLRQVKSEQTFVDIITPDTNQTVMNFYLSGQVGTNQDQNGLFTNFSGSPFVTWTIQNPNPGTTNSLNIIENRSGTVSTQSLVKTASTGGVTWTLTQGSGAATRVETRQVSFTGSPATNRVELDTISYSGSGTPDYQCQETYHFYPWGSELVETEIPTTNPLITTYEFYDNLKNPETYSVNGNGQLKEINYPDGHWEKRIYEDVAGAPSIGDVWADYYPYPGLLRWVLTPRTDDLAGAATSPETATTDNSVPTIYSYVPEIVGSLGQDFDSGQTTTSFFDSTNSDDVFDARGVGLGTVNFGEGLQNLNTDFIDPHYSAYDTAYVTDTATYDDSTPPGLAGHVGGKDNELGGWTSTWSYYDHGIFDTSLNAFVLDPSNHLYTVTGYTNQYPDHRETDIYQGEPWYLNNWSGYYNTSLDGDDYFEYGDYYASLEDHPVFHLLNYYHPNVSRKTTRIYHGGNLVQTEDYVYLGDPNEWQLLNKTRYYVDSLGRATNITILDGVTAGHARTVYSADYVGGTGHDGPLLLSETDENGRQTVYTYDSLQRIQTSTITGHGTQPNCVTTCAYNANGQILSETEQAGSLSLGDTWVYDIGNRQVSHADSGSGVIASAYSADGMTTTTTYPGGVTSIRQNNQARQVESVQGTGAVSDFYDYAYSSYFQLSSSYDGEDDCQDFGTFQTDFKGHSGSPRWTKHLIADTGYKVADERPSGTSNTNIIWSDYIFGEDGRLNMVTCSPGQANTSYLYDHFGNKSLQNLDSAILSTWGQVNWNDNCRVKFSREMTVQIGGNWFDATTNYTTLADGAGDATVTGAHLEQLNGFTGTETACTIDYDADTNETITTTTIDFSNNKITTVTSEPSTSSLSATTVVQNGLPISSSTLSVANPTLYFYDAFGRTNQIQSPLGYSAYINYDPATGWVTSQTDFTGQTTSYQYYNTNEANAGKLKCQTSATGKKTYYAYTTQGQLYQTWGDVPFPAEYNYNEYGDMTNLVTFRGGSGWTGSSWPTNTAGTNDNTYWFYDAASGALTNKTDAQGNATIYTYYPETGRLMTRSWQRTIGSVPVTVTNLYDSSYRDGSGVLHDDSPGYGDLVEQDYNDGTPSVIFNNYSRAAQPREIVDVTGTNELTYDFASRLISSACTNGLMAGITVSNHFNPYYGRDSVSVQGLSSSLEDDYTYESFSGRLSSVGSGPYLAVYSYAPNSDLLQTTTCSSNGAPILTTTRTWDYGVRLHSIANVVGSTPVTSHSYQYDALNRRTQATLEDGSSWQYGYDNRDELTSAKRNWASWENNSPVAGQQFSYAYDTIGNRQTAQFGGDINGANLRTITYTNNSLNQYVGITTPGYGNIIGAALATNGVTVNGSAADRKAEYFHKELAVANSSGPIWQNITNVSGTFTNTGGLVFPANGQGLAYDADGNLSFDGIWNYQWDGENRLISMTMTNGIANIAATNVLKLNFAYDFMGRRIQKTVYQWNGSGFGTNPVSQVRFIYDGWNLLAEVATNNAAVRSYMWGNDLSGTMTKAGGVGGLLMASISGANCFATYDGNGNITALINAADKSMAARYEYSPYGQLLRETGVLAQQNPFRYSSKFWDEESGLVNYNARYYSPSLGKWIGRDPTTDQVFLNLYLFCHNNPLIRFDKDGKDDADLGDVLSACSEGVSLDANMCMAIILDAGEGQSVADLIGAINASVSIMANSVGAAASTAVYGTLEATSTTQIASVTIAAICGYLGESVEDINGLPGLESSLSNWANLSGQITDKMTSPEGLELLNAGYNATIYLMCDDNSDN